jgi:1,4-dihydroxy-2-naphthoate octaprenyltransferase
MDYLRVDKIRNFMQALRLPFASASILPFIAGSLLAKGNFSFSKFLLGCIAALSTHLSANLINDYADSQSGVDWQDKRFYGFFGGSKLIQEGVLTERFYLNFAIFFAVLAALSLWGVVLISHDISAIGYFLLIIILAWSYSHKPLQLSYRRFGEPIIFLLFGPALVMGGYYIQTGIFPDLKSFLISLPFGLLTTAILYVNEIPDLAQDLKAGKKTWVSLFGPERAFRGYGIICLCVFLSIILCVVLGYFSPLSLASFLFITLALSAMKIAKNYPKDKIRLMESSKLTINMQELVSLVLILDVMI